MRGPGAGAILYSELRSVAVAVIPDRPERSTSSPTSEAGTGMERTDWLDGGLDSADARFLMLTAITHHQFSSPIWGEHEVRKLHAELAELDVLATWAVADQAVSRSERRRASIRSFT